MTQNMYLTILWLRILHTIIRFHGVAVSTQDSESCDPSSNLGGTFCIFFFIFFTYSEANRRWSMALSSMGHSQTSAQSLQSIADGGGNY
jgi:hypothetical protein